MASADKYVDGDFLAKLLSGSYEVSVSHVDSAVSESAELFGGEHSEVRVLGTFSGNAIVANSSGEFFRAAYAVEEGVVKLGEVAQIDVPVKEASELSVDARRVSESVVNGIFSGDADLVESGIEELYGLVSNGVRLTVESVSQGVDASLDDNRHWRVSMNEDRDGVLKVAGAAAHAELPKPRFESLEGDDGRVCRVVEAALRSARTTLNEMSDRLELARTIDESVDFGQPKAALEFMDFVASLDGSLSELTSCVGDGLALMESGSVDSLAKIHDAVVTGLPDLNLATAFAEGIALRFAPKAA